MNSLDTRSVSMLACLFIEGLGDLDSWISAGKVWTHQISLFTLVYEFKKHLRLQIFPPYLADEKAVYFLAMKYWILLNRTIKYLVS